DFGSWDTFDYYGKVGIFKALKRFNAQLDLMSKQLSKFVLAGALSLALNLSATPVSDNGKLRVQGLQLVNECGNPVQLKGVSSHGLQWFGMAGSDTTCLKAASLDFIANDSTGMGADIFRAAM